MPSPAFAAAMIHHRSLPTRRNHFLTEKVPPHDDLVARRRLGRTRLTQKSGDVTYEDASVFDYVHLRAPLQKGIVSGVFKSSPATYFLMRRSSDGFVSATGMFKATFPYSEVEEEDAERTYVKSLPTTSPDETAGNIWVPPAPALVLADEYGILPWIRALLDPTTIKAGPGTSASDGLQMPPVFDLDSFDLEEAIRELNRPAEQSHAELSASLPSESQYSTIPTSDPPVPVARSARSRRSASPMKTTETPKRRSARQSSRQPSEVPSTIAETIDEGDTSLQVSRKTVLSMKLDRKKRTKKTDMIQEEQAAAAEYTGTMEVPTSSFDFVAPVIKASSDEYSRGQHQLIMGSAEDDGKYKVEVTQDKKRRTDGVEETRTEVSVQMPLSSMPPSKEETQRMLAIAKKQVAEATKELATGNPSKPTTALSSREKRKADQVELYDEEKLAKEGMLEPSSKRSRMAVQRRKQVVRRRAWLSLTATFAVGTILPYLLNSW